MRVIDFASRIFWYAKPTSGDLIPNPELLIAEKFDLTHQLSSLREKLLTINSTDAATRNAVSDLKFEIMDL